MRIFLISLLFTHPLLATVEVAVIEQTSEHNKPISIQEKISVSETFSVPLAPKKNLKRNVSRAFLFGFTASAISTFILAHFLPPSKLPTKQHQENIEIDIDINVEPEANISEEIAITPKKTRTFRAPTLGSGIGFSTSYWYSKYLNNHQRPPWQCIVACAAGSILGTIVGLAAHKNFNR